MVDVVSPPGDQRYVPPPAEGVPTSVVDAPSHIVSSTKDIVGVGVTVIVDTSDALEHPFNV